MRNGSSVGRPGIGWTQKLSKILHGAPQKVRGNTRQFSVSATRFVQVEEASDSEFVQALTFRRKPVQRPAPQFCVGLRIFFWWQRQAQILAVAQDLGAFVSWWPVSLRRKEAGFLYQGDLNCPGRPTHSFRASPGMTAMPRCSRVTLCVQKRPCRERQTSFGGGGGFEVPFQSSHFGFLAQLSSHVRLAHARLNWLRIGRRRRHKLQLRSVALLRDLAPRGKRTRCPERPQVALPVPQKASWKRLSPALKAPSGHCPRLGTHFPRGGWAPPQGMVPGTRCSPSCLSYATASKKKQRF